MPDILFLGTGASVPSRERSMPGVAVRCGTDIALFDCGEGTQRQLMISKFSFMKIKGIFITHVHGDHILGLPGLLQTMGLSGRTEKLTVCGPKGFSEGLNKMMTACGEYPEYEIETKDLSGGEEIDLDGMSVRSFETDHSVPSIGYVLSEHDMKGKFDKKKAMLLGISPGPDFSKLMNGEKVGDVTPDMVVGPPRPGCRIVYSGDTVPCEGLYEAAKNADVLIHEATFADSELHLATEHKHSTARQAAETAEHCGCRMLFMIHTSNRYEDKTILENEAKAVFADSVVPNDLDMYTVSKSNIRSS